MNRMIKMKNRTFAIAAAPAATPKKPKIPAMIATTRKISAHLTIAVDLIGEWNLC
jgi:hypothetical protein